MYTLKVFLFDGLVEEFSDFESEDLARNAGIYLTDWYPLKYYKFEVV